MNIASIKGSIELEDNSFKRVVENAKRSFTSLGRAGVESGRQIDAGAKQAASALRDQSQQIGQLTDQMLRQRQVMQSRVEAQRQALVEDARLREATQQRISLERELLAETSRLSQVLKGEGDIAQQVAAKYSLLSEAEQRQLVIVREQVQARQAVARAEEAAAAASEKAAEREVAASEKAAAAAEKAARRRISASQLGQSVSRLGRAATIGITAPVVGLAGAGIKAFGDMEQNLNVLEAVSGATQEQMKLLGAEAIKLGGDMTLPATSAADAARAMLELKQAGLDVDTALKSARPTLLLTAATGMDVGESARFAASMLNTFKLAPRELSHVNDMLVASQGAAGTKINELKDAVASAGSTFKTVGRTPLELVTSLALLSQAGLRGATAGTALRVMLQNIGGNTKQAKAALKDLGVSAYDLQGRLKPIPQIIGEFSKALERFNPKARLDILRDIFGARAGLAAPILFRGAEGFTKMAQAIDKQGAAAAAAEARNKGLKGAIDALKSAFETALIQGIGPIKDDLQLFARRVGELAKQFSDLPAPVRKNIVEFLALAAAIGPVLLLIGQGIILIGNLKKVILFVKETELLLKFWNVLKGVGGFLVSFPGMLTLALAGTATFFAGFVTNFDHWGDRLKQGLANIRDSFSQFWSNFALMGKSAWANLRDNGLKAFSTLADDFKRGLSELGNIFRLGWERFSNIVTGRGDPLNKMVAREKARLTAPPAGAGGVVDYHDVPMGGLGRARGGPPVLPLPGQGTAAPPGGDPYNREDLKKHKLTQEERERIREREETSRRKYIQHLMQDGETINGVLRKFTEQEATYLAKNRTQPFAQRLQNLSLKEAAEAYTKVQKVTESARGALDRYRAANEQLRLQIKAGVTEETHAVAARASAAFGSGDPKVLAALDREQANNERLKAIVAERKKVAIENENILERIRKAIGEAAARVEARRRGETVSTPAAIPSGAMAGRFPGRTPQIQGERAALMGLLALDQKEATQREIQVTVLNAQAAAMDNLFRQYDAAQAKSIDLAGGTDAEVAAFKLLATQLDFTDREVQDLVMDYLALTAANEAKALSNKEAAAAAKEAAKVDELLTNTTADLNSEFATLLGLQPEQSRAINRLAADTKNLSIEQLLQLDNIKKQFKQRELLREASHLADGIGDIFRDAFTGLQDGFKGFFSGIYQGFRKLLIDMASEYLASQLKQVVMKGLSSLIGIAAGAATGGGGTQMSGGGGVDLGGGGFQTASAGRMLVGQSAGGGAATASTGGGPVTVLMNFHGVTDVPGFRRNEKAMAAHAVSVADKLRRRNR